MPYMRVPSTLQQEIKVAPGKIPAVPEENPLENPLENALPNGLIARLARSAAAGRHCHRFLVVGSGIKFCSEAIAPWGAVELSSVSEAPIGDQTRGFPGSGLFIHPLKMFVELQQHY